jgi:uncharacterized protein YraI
LDYFYLNGGFDLQPPIKILALLAILLMMGTVWAEEEKSPQKGVVMATRVNFRSDPGLSGPVITSLFKNTEVTILEDNGLWYKVKLIDNHEGWVSKNYINTNRSFINSRGLGYSGLVSYAKNFLRTNYRYGGTSPSGFDCSGFTQYVYAKFGYQIPHSSTEQLKMGIPVSRDNLFPSDLLFFNNKKSKQVNHVGIYIGNNKFIHAASSFGAVRISNLNEQYYQTRFLSARRIINNLSLNNQNSSLSLPEYIK